MNYKPFDLEAAKRGEPVMLSDGTPARIVCFDRKHPHGYNLIVVCDRNIGYEDTQYFKESTIALVMKPLTFIEGRPVYAGDTIYYKRTDFGRAVVKGFDGRLIVESEGYKVCYEPHEGLTWTKPKQKKSGWINIYAMPIIGGYETGTGINASKEDALQRAAKDVIDTIQIHWEE